MAFDPTGQTLASGSSDNTVKLWEPASGKLLRTLEGHTATVYSVAFDPTGQTLASGSEDETDGEAVGAGQRQAAPHPRRARRRWLVAWRLTPRARHWPAGADDKTVKLWEPASGKLLRTLEGHTASVLMRGV